MVQVDEDAEYLQGSMRFMGSLFREHHLPFALVRTLVTDLTSHSEKVHHYNPPVSSTHLTGPGNVHSMLRGPRKLAGHQRFLRSPQPSELNMLSCYPCVLKILET